MAHVSSVIRCSIGRSFRCILGVLVVGVLTLPASLQADVVEEFNTFALSRFGAKHEPLVQETFGQTLKLNDAATWSHVSENSAVLAFATNIPAITHIEFGQAGKLDQKTPASVRPFYTHIHHVKGMTRGQTYSYRFVATDEAGNTVVLHEGTLSPKKIPNAIYIPGDMGQPPYNLTKAGATYVLTQDIVAPATAINIMAGNIKLDLNGFTVTYDDVPGSDLGPEKGFGHFGELNPHGVRGNYSARGSSVVNGFIVQGKANRGYGSQPVYSNTIEEVAGLNIRYAGEQLVGIMSGKDVHHNVILDGGTRITDRHMGISGLQSPSVARYNLIQRARQRGITGQSNGRYLGNEIYIDSFATNSFGIMFYKQTNAVAEGNLIFGTGYHSIGIGTVSAGVSNIRVENNFIHLEATKPVGRSAEYGNQSEAECVRVTWGGENIQYLNNVMIAKAEEGGEAGGIWHYSQAEGQRDVVYRGNTIKVLRKEDRVSDKLEGAIRICGDSKNGDHAPVLIENNRVISNFCNVRLGDEYGSGNNARFVNNTFIREGDHNHYVTVRAGHYKRDSKGHVFENNRLENGASFDLVQWAGTGERGFTVIDNGQTRTFSP